MPTQHQIAVIFDRRNRPLIIVQAALPKNCAAHKE
jgi:hypothetical protein